MISNTTSSSATWRFRPADLCARASLTFFSISVACLGDTNNISAGSPVFEKMRANSAGLKTMYCEFIQERLVSLLKDPVVSEGAICFQKPGSARWETTKPYQSILLATAREVEQFEMADAKWQRLNIGYKEAMRNVMNHMTAVWSGKLADENRDFSFLVATGAMVTVTMIPKRDAMKKMIAAIEIHLVPDLSEARKVVMKEANGDSTTITFVSQTRNAALPAGTFDMVEPIALEKIRQAVSRKAQ